MGLPFSAIVKYVMGGFNPLSWFAKGEQGAWHDPSDLTTLFQESVGVTPVTAVEQPVGLMLDKSKGLALGAELNTGNGFSSWLVLGGTWTLSSTSAIGSSATGFIYTASIENVSNGYYEISGVVSNYSAGNFFISVSDGSQNSNLIATNGNFSVRCYDSIADQLNKAIYIKGNGFTGTITNLSVKQIAGNHAFQATAGNRPLLSARVNLLTKTEDFSDAAWSKVTTTVTPNDVIAPDGTLTASKIVFANNTSEISCGGFTLIGATLGTAWVKGTAGQTVHFYDGVSAVTPSLLTGVWQQLSFPSSTGVKYFDLGASNGATARTVWLWHPDLRPTNSGALLPPYQRVNTASDYDTVGFPLYLKANGTSSAMSTNSIDFTSTDKMTVVTGVRKLSDADFSIYTELSVDLNANNNSFYIGNRASSLVNAYGFASKGTVINFKQDDNTKIAPISNVITLQSSISTPQLIGRVDAINKVTSSATQGVGTFGNYPLYLFARAGTSAFLNGQFYGAIIRGAQSDTASVTQTENYMATKTGITF